VLQPPLIFVLLVAVSVAGAEGQRRLAGRGLRLPAVEGPLWIAVGWALGNPAVGLFPDDVLEVLRVVVLVGLAWIGLVFGMQIDRAVLRRLETWHRRVGLGAPLVVGILLLAAAALLDLPKELALGLAAVGLVCSPATLDAAARTGRPTDRAAFRLLRMVAAFSGIPAVLAFGAATVLWGPLSNLSGGVVPWWHLAAAMAGIGLLAGYSIVVLVRGLNDTIGQLTVLVGCAALIAGAAAVLGISPLPPAVVAGTVVVNRAVFPHRLLRVTHTFERPLLIAMLVLVGASITGLSFSWMVFVLLTLVRFAAVLVGGRWLRDVAARHGHHIAVRWLGTGWLTQGALALGLTVALLGVFEGHHGVLEAIAAAMIVNQIVAQLFARRLFFTTDGQP
jgi:hypothetical protein